VGSYVFGPGIETGVAPVGVLGFGGIIGPTHQSGCPEIPMTSLSIPMKSNPNARRKIKSHTASTGATSTTKANPIDVRPTTVARTRYHVGNFAELAAIGTSIVSPFRCL
jgi:hypothetical protein